MLLKSLLKAVLILLILQAVSANVDVEKSVLDELIQENTVNVIISFKSESLPDEVSRFRNVDKRKFYQEKDVFVRSRISSHLSKISKNGIDIDYISGLGNWISAKITPAGLESLKGSNHVKKIMLDKVIQGGLDVSVPLINASDVWDYGYDGEGQVICVLDSGVNASHPALIGRISEQYCYCSYGGGCCQGATESDDATDDHGHGTHVTGIIISDNSTYTGVAPKAKVASVKVLNNNKIGLLSDLGKGISWCLINATNITVIHTSIYVGATYNETSDPPCPTDIDSQINAAYDSDIPFTTITGNENIVIGISYPGCSANATAVGATTDADTIWDQAAGLGTNRHKWMDILAPGVSIVSTTYTGGYAGDTGTSMAGPHVSGAAAIMKQIEPSITPDEIKTILNKTGKQIYDDDTNLTFPRVNVFGAVSYMAFSDTLVINNTGSITLEVYNITWTKPWIYNAIPNNFSLEENESQEVILMVDPRDENIGIYSGSIVIRSNDPDEENKTLEVVMKILSEGCTGDCPPPVSGDWTIDEDTTVYQTPVEVDGKIIIEEMAELYLVDTQTNLTTIAEMNGSIELDTSLFNFN